MPTSMRTRLPSARSRRRTRSVGQLRPRRGRQSSRGLCREKLFSMRVIETLMVIAVEHAGAVRGVAELLLDGEQLHVEAVASTGRDGGRRIALGRGVGSRPAFFRSRCCASWRGPARVVILNDALAERAFSADPYIQTDARPIDLVPPAYPADAPGGCALPGEQPHDLRLHQAADCGAGVGRCPQGQRSRSRTRGSHADLLQEENRGRLTSEERLRRSRSRPHASAAPRARRAARASICEPGK